VFRISTWSGGGATLQWKRSMVIKRLTGSGRREARVYREILRPIRSDFSPALLGIRHAATESRLYLEAIRPATRWPWSETRASVAVLQSMARLHQVLRSDPAQWAWLTEWDYEAELQNRAQDLIEFVEESCRCEHLTPLRRSRPMLRRMASALPKLRAQLLGFAPFGPTFIHGDVHPGNVLMRKAQAGTTPLFLDWGRSRIGSALEDVASWLQTLGYWEPAAKRRHDSLLRAYLEETGVAPRLTRKLRDAYWLAAASNLLAGAILHHLGIASRPGAIASSKRFGALRAVEDCLRVVRRADACWSQPVLGMCRCDRRKQPHRQASNDFDRSQIPIFLCRGRA
jgi:hypothetical protein